MPAENVFAEMVQSEEERKELQKIAQVKRQGYDYFKLIYVGRIPVAQINIRGLKSIEAYRSTNEDGSEKWVGKPGADAYFFMEDSLGNKFTQIWDDPDGYNRAWVSRHVGYERAEFELEDKDLEKQVLAISGTPYKVELSEEETLERQLRDTRNRLDALRQKKTQEELLPKRRGRIKSQQPPEVVQEA